MDSKNFDWTSKKVATCARNYRLFFQKGELIALKSDDVLILLKQYANMEAPNSGVIHFSSGPISHVCKHIFRSF